MKKCKHKKILCTISISATGTFKDKTITLKSETRDEELSYAECAACGWRFKETPDWDWDKPL